MSLPIRKRRRVARSKLNRLRQFEQLEARRVLTAELASVLEMASMIAPHRDGIQGLTVVTHGFQTSADSGDSLLPLATAVRDRTEAENGSDSSAWLLDYDVRGDGFSGGFDLNLNASDDGSNNGSFTWGIPSEIVMLFDWAPESNEISTGWGEAAGDALFTLLTSLDLLRLAPGASNPSIHFIGHSFGAAVTSEAIERMAFYDVPVDQLTLLDPHDFDESGIPVDEAQRLFDIGKPQQTPSGQQLSEGYGAAVWDNVAFADVYYQTRPILLVPEGRPIPGAHNQLMNSQTDVAASWLPHSSIWEDFYIGTILDTHRVAIPAMPFREWRPASIPGRVPTARRRRRTSMPSAKITSTLPLSCYPPLFHRRPNDRRLPAQSRSPIGPGVPRS